MDSITQAALGAAVGEATLGKKAGNMAPLWGAVLGTLPDLDVIFNPFLSELEQLSFHRGPTHSLLFALVTAPLFGLLLARLHRKSGADWKHWTLLAFLAVHTHALLDTLTNYGTQLFWPFTDYPVAIPTVAIVDPLYTLPLSIGVLAALFMRRDSRGRRLANNLGLLLSSLYLLATGINKIHIDGVFRDALRAEGVTWERMITSPTVLNNVLWVGLADDGDHVWYGLHSLLDEAPVELHYIRKNNEYVADMMDTPAMQKLLWFSQGFYTVDYREDGLYFNDMHVGRRDGWVGKDNSGYIFSFRLRFPPGDSTRLLGIQPVSPSFDVDSGSWDRFVDRVLGNRK